LTHLFHKEAIYYKVEQCSLGLTNIHRQFNNNGSTVNVLNILYVGLFPVALLVLDGDDEITYFSMQ